MDRAAWLKTIPEATDAATHAVATASSPVLERLTDPWSTAVTIQGSLPSARIVDAHGARSEGDRMLCLGRALGCVPPADPAGIATALAHDPPAAVIFVGGALPDTACLERLDALAPTIRWFHLAWPELEAAPVEPADPALAALGALPRGLPGRLPSADHALRPSDPARTALHRPIPCAPTSPMAAVLAAELLHGQLRLAEDGPLPLDTTIADLFGLHWLADHHPSTEVAARAGAAAARIRLAWGQPAIAQTALHAARARLDSATPALLACLDQAEGDVLAQVGEMSAAGRAYDQAAARLGDARDAPLLLRFTRRRAEMLLARGRPDLARPHLREARAIARDLGEPLASAASLRASGDAAAAAGEQLGAEALYDQAGVTPVPSGERTNRLLGEVALALRREDAAQAGVLLSRLPPDADGLARAGALHRAAEHALHRRDLDRARAAASGAAEAFARTGTPLGQARSLRLLGDALAASGARQAALKQYAEALGLQIRTRDTEGARRTLSNAAHVASAAGEASLAARLLELAESR